MPRIPIESKHTYISYDGVVGGTTQDAQVFAQIFNPERPLVNFMSPSYPSTGTDESNRIGRKIRTDSLVSEFFLNLFNTVDNENLNTLYDYYALSNSDVYQDINSQVSPQTVTFNSDEQALDVSIRHFIVELDSDTIDDLGQDEIHQYLYEWFYETFIYTGAYNMHSNRQQVKRESTRFTGTFNILYDKVIHLSLRQPIYHGNVVIPYVRHLNFDGTGSINPTNKIVFQVFIGPTNPYIDYGNFNLGQFIYNTSPDAGPNMLVASLQNTLKLNFTDL